MTEIRYTKTFIRQVWYRRLSDDGVQWQQLHEEGAELDEQIRAWVEATGAIIIHPGQLGLHTQWQDQQLSVKCVTTGQTLLYVEGQDAPRRRQGAETEGVEAHPGGAIPFADPETPGGATAAPGATTAASGTRADAAKPADVTLDATGPTDAGGDAGAQGGQPATGGASSHPGVGRTEPERRPTIGSPSRPTPALFDE